MKRLANDVIDDSSDSRQGKRIAREGMEGKWPSFVFIPVQGGPTFETLKQTCIHRFRRGHQLTQDELASISEIENTHISLSREFSLRYHQIEPFVSRLDAHLPPILRSFKVEVFSKYSILFNEAKSKAFLCLRLNLDDTPVDEDDSDLLKLIRCVDKALCEFQQPEYHQNPILHISIASFTPSEVFVQRQLAEASNERTKIYDLQGSHSDAIYGSAVDLLSMYDDSNEDGPIVTSEDDSSVEAAVVPIQTVIASDIVLTVGFQQQYRWSLGDVCLMPSSSRTGLLTRCTRSLKPT